jgi:hypothetical protein
MKIPTPATITLGALLLFSLTVQAEETETNLPPDPFKDIKTAPKPEEYAMKVDRERGKISIDAKDGKYTPGSHFANWNWTMKANRWGRYFVSLRYTSDLPKLGIQVKIGDNTVKSYAPRTGGHEKHQEYSVVMGYAYIDKPGEYPVTLLTGDKSNGPGFFVKGIDLIPAPESDEVSQGIDGTIELHAKTATTFSEMMRYEPKPEKNCLGYWVNEDDWAEWNFDLTSPGKFKIEVVHGCGPDNGGSEVAVLVNGETLKFKVEDTGGFQNWKTHELGIVEMDRAGENKIAIKPLTKSGKAVMDIQKVMLTPVEG